MSGATDDRRAELIAAAIAGDLTVEESKELDGLRRADPAVDAELRELALVSDRVTGVGEWVDVEPSMNLRGRIADAVASDRADRESLQDPVPIGAGARGARGRGRGSTKNPSRRFGVPVLAGLAAASLLVGVVVGVLIPRAVEVDSLVVGPPGTLGAVEDVSFIGEPAGVRVEGELIAHTWGTETVLHIDGLPVGAEYTVIAVDRDGRQVPSGTFLGSSVPVDCQMNAALLREDVASVSILDATGSPIATASVPAVES